MKDIILDPQDYDGSQLHHAFAYEKAGVLGDSIVSFMGAAYVKDHLVDLEDSLSNDFISSEKMLHYIIEIFDINITETVLWQRVLVKAVIDELIQDAFNPSKLLPGPLEAAPIPPKNIYRKGDDVMIEDHDGQSLKMSVSIATLSRFSGLIHLGVNINVGKNCPVAAIGLSDLGYNNLGVRFFQENVIQRFIKEFNSVKNATYKVKEV